MSVNTSSEHEQLIGNVSHMSSGNHQGENVEILQAIHTDAHTDADELTLRSLTEAAWSETAIAQSAPETVSEEFNATDAAWLLLPLWFAVVWVVLFFAFSEGLRLTQGKFSKSRPVSRIPCKQCRFYTNSAYLKCAVNPLDAATEKAIACSDYDAKPIEEPSGLTHRNSNVKFR